MKLQSVGEKSRRMAAACHPSRCGAVHVALLVLGPMVRLAPGDAVMMMAARLLVEMLASSNGARNCTFDAAMPGGNATQKFLLPLRESTICMSLRPSLRPPRSQLENAMMRPMCLI